MSSSTFARRVSDATMPLSPTFNPLTRVAVPTHLMKYAPGPLALLAQAGGVPLPVSASAWADALALVNAASAGPSSADALDAHAWWLTLVSAAENGVGPRDSTTTVNFNKPWSGADDVFSNNTEVSSFSRRRDFDAYNGLAPSPTHASASTQTMHTASTHAAFQHQYQPRRQTRHDNVGSSATATSSPAAARTATATINANRRHSAEPNLPSPVVPTFAMHSVAAVTAGPAPMRGATEAFNLLAADIPSLPSSDDEDELSGDEPSDQIITPARHGVAPAPSATSDDTDAAIADILDELDLHRDLIADSAAQLERLHPRANARDANKRRQYLSLPLLEVLNDSGVAPPSSLAPLRSRTDISLLSRGELAEWVAYYNGFCPPTSIEGMQRALCACVGVKYDFGGAGCIEDADGGWKEPSPEEAAASEAAAIARAQEERELYGDDYNEYDEGYESEEPERMPWDDEDDDYEPPHFHYEYDPSWPTVLLGEEPGFSSDADDGGWGKTVTLDLYADEVIRTPDEVSGSAKTGAPALDHTSLALSKDSTAAMASAATADDSDAEWVDASDGAAFLAY